MVILQQHFPLGRFHANPWKAFPFDDPFFSPAKTLTKNRFKDTSTRFSPLGSIFLPAKPPAFLFGAGRHFRARNNKRSSKLRKTR